MNPWAKETKCFPKEKPPKEDCMMTKTTILGKS